MTAAGGVAGLLALGSIAMACVPYKGKMEVEGIGAGAGTVEVVGNNQSMDYCPGTDYGPPAELPSQNGVTSFKLKVKPNNHGDCSGGLPPSQFVGLYGVRFWSGSPTPLGTTREDDKCFAWDPESQRLGDIIVDAAGYGEGVYTIPAGARPGYGAVCVQHPAAGFLGGNRAPILVL